MTFSGVLIPSGVQCSAVFEDSWRVTWPIHPQCKRVVVDSILHRASRSKSLIENSDSMPTEDVICRRRLIHGLGSKPSSRLGIRNVYKNSLTVLLKLIILNLFQNYLKSWSLIGHKFVVLYLFSTFGRLSASDREALMQGSFSDILFKWHFR